ncbi:MAG: TatD family hydrolase [Treponema sp.]|jgi:TatD DNase family protein|nr:TatD family hydrolase [Treponema sp.]
MLTDAHCHPAALAELFPGAEAERRRLGVGCAASATSREEFEFHRELAQKAAEEGAAPVLRCFAVHPQLPALWAAEGAAGEKPPGRLTEGGAKGTAAERLRGLAEYLETSAAEGRLDAVGETGFDLYNSAFRETEALQEKLFQVHLETARRRDLPLVLHVRRAMHKVFAYGPELRKISAVIFHSWPGTLGEGEALLRRGINVFFSFGTPLLLNHKEARRCCASLPAEHLLLETDAPWQPLRGKAFSAWADLPAILREAASLRREAGKPGADPEELEQIVEANFFRAFAPG